MDEILARIQVPG